MDVHIFLFTIYKSLFETILDPALNDVENYKKLFIDTIKPKEKNAEKSYNYNSNAVEEAAKNPWMLNVKSNARAW
jgi:hypothetical protein